MCESPDICLRWGGGWLLFCYPLAFKLFLWSNEKATTAKLQGTKVLGWNKLSLKKLCTVFVLVSEFPEHLKDASWKADKKSISIAILGHL